MSIYYVDVVNGIDNALSISAMTQTSPISATTSTSHGISSGESVSIWNCAGFTYAGASYVNRYTFKVGNTNTNTLELVGTNGTSYTAYTGSGKVTNRGFTSTTPLLNLSTCSDLLSGNCEVRISKTPVASSYNVFAQFTLGAATLSCASDMTSYISIGDYIGKPTAAGNGAHETYYRVNGITSTTITLDSQYYGTTEVVASLKKIQPIVTGTVNDNIANVTMSQTTFTGGWDLTGVPVQNGETWIKSPNARTYNTGYATSQTGCAFRLTYPSYLTFKKINAVEVYYGVYSHPSFTGLNIEECTFNAYYCGVSRYNGTTGGNNIKNSVFISYASYTFYGYFAGVDNIIENCYFGGNTSAAGVFSVIISYVDTNTILTYKDNVIMGKAYGLQLTPYVVNYQGTNKIYNCTYGIYNMWGGSSVNNINFYNCTYGINPYVGNDTYTGEIYVRDCYFYNMIDSGLFYNYYNKESIIERCTFENCARAANVGNAAGGGIFIDCNFNTIGQYAVQRGTYSGPCTFTNCTIDNPAKAYNIPSPTYPAVANMSKICILNNSFGKTGTIWGAGSKLLTTTNYKTVSPGLEIQWNTAYSSSISNFKNYMPMKIMSTMVNSGASATFNFYMKTSNAAWSGNLQPVWRLNSSILKTESTAITSLSTNWLPYSYNTTGVSITAAGELSLEFVPNMNTYAIYLSDFTIT